MPRGRMLNKKITQDDKIAKISLKAKLLFTWSIPFLDQKGRIYGDIWTLKAIVPLVTEIKPKDILPIIKEWVKADLVVYYGDDVHKYLEFKGFGKNQNINEEREAPSEIPNPTDKLKIKSGVGQDKVNANIIQYNTIQEKATQEFFSYYLLKTKKKFTLSDARVKLIKTRLKDYPLEDMKRAVDNFTQDTWEGRKDHMDLVYVIGIRNKIDNLEKWLNKGSQRRLPS